MKRSRSICCTKWLSVWVISCSFLAASVFATSSSDLRETSAFPADVVTSWTTLQLQIARTTPAPPPITIRRCAFTGIALYESIVPGLPQYQSIAPQLNGLGALPHAQKDQHYYWPASANAALAAITRSLYPMTSAVNKTAIDSLEAANITQFKKDIKNEELARSAAFGKSIATVVFEWSKTDGSDSKTPFTMTGGTGNWVPTPPALMNASLPYWGRNRPLVLESDQDADLETPVPYSTDPSSDYYAQVKEVYDISQSLTPEQKTIALFWADDPDGKSFGGAHWLSILNQILIREKSSLEVAAVANVLMSITCYETTISIFKGKYRHNGLRPITYVRTVMNMPGWNTLISTPPHPEYPSGHAMVSAAAAQTLTSIFGKNYKFTDDSYNLLGFSPRHYQSFEEAAIEAGNSRIYGGIHYRKTCEAGQRQGRKIAQNVSEKLKFRKG
jgi:hypothetical protein